MTTYQTPLVVGIFENEIKAKNAVDALRTAGFRYDQVGVALSASENATPDLQTDLVNLGVPEEQAKYYDNEYRSGKIVVSIRPDGRASEVSDILTSNGAYNYEQQASSDMASPSASVDSEQVEPARVEDNQPQETHNEATLSSNPTEDQ
ncbi:hypothetical protein KDW_23460 [Dictyobacter vulcani]|uniref:General stress protein 17M-like domain-containing protein n=1 Tax=Dictyobacter vulcani TaxID=2607529 RepID=A0A5J4KFL5_9CHLR|nr:hypothetical protein [Dictyobacter vulcani]GER88184.1 hypothetical protein KDW_23460 [Dictyobacter vulcani]